MTVNLVKPIDRKLYGRQMVLEAGLRLQSISRAAFAEARGLNVANMSRVTRALIKAGPTVETESYGPGDRSGRRFVGLKPRGKGEM